MGFSGIVSIGDQLDVDIADLLDYFALDIKTRAILLYVEAIKDARKFMSAARAAARVKPVVVVKSGRWHKARERRPPIPAPWPGEQRPSVSQLEQALLALVGAGERAALVTEGPSEELAAECRAVERHEQM